MTLEMFAILWIYFVPIVGGLVAVWVRFCIDEADLDAAVEAEAARSVTGLREAEVIRESRQWRASRIAAEQARRVDQYLWADDQTMQLRMYSGHRVWPPTGYHPDLAARGWTS